MTSNISTEREYLFVIEIRNEVYYKDQVVLADFLKTLPHGIRIYAIIHAGMNMLKIYCATRVYRDITAVSEITGYVTEIVDSNKRLPGIQ